MVSRPMSSPATLPRIRQVVVAAHELDPVAGELAAAMGLGEPFADPGVGYFGLRNAVFALGDTFIEVVSPVRPDTSAGRLLERRGGDCGYMIMIQVSDLAASQSAAAAAGVREVFEVELPDIGEVHLHPGDMRGAIVSVSTPVPPQAWRWGGPDWRERAAPLQVTGATVAVADPDATRERWSAVLGGPPPIAFVADAAEPGLVEVAVAGLSAPVHTGGVRFVPERNHEEGP
jgi:hypothetical protein